MNQEIHAKLLEILFELAKGKPIAQARIQTDAKKLYNTFIMGSYRRKWRATDADAAHGKMKLQSTADQAMKLSNSLERLPNNLRRAFRSDVDDLINKAKVIEEDVRFASHNFIPSSRHGARKVDAQMVENYAASIFVAYTGREYASMTRDPITGKLSGQYYDFAMQILEAFGITANLEALIAARKLREKKRAARSTSHLL